MKSFKVALAALALSGCSAQSSTHTLAVTGSPEEVARFVAAEEAREGVTDVKYRSGGKRAVFFVPTSHAQTDMRLRASAARLAAEEKSASWTFGLG